MKRILVIEDQPQMRNNLVRLLELNGYEAVGAENGRRGVELATAQPPDLILCDVMMPELDGYGVLAALRSIPATESIPFIFLTARGDKREQRAGMNLGADDYLTKPVPNADLLETVRTRLARFEKIERQARTRVARGPDFSSAEPLRALGLTPREAEVLLWIAQGKSNPEIAVILGMAAPTAKKHVSNILEKLGCETRAAAIVLTLEHLIGASN
jgi:DNA-binding NarL/FixJ family response regulator